MAHLTNYAVNRKAGARYHTPAAYDDAAASKWTLAAYRRLLRDRYGRAVDARIWGAVEDMVVKMFTAVAEETMTEAYWRYVPRSLRSQPRGALFQVFGLDVMLDKDLRPWLIEINSSPALATDSAVDIHVRGEWLPGDARQGGTLTNLTRRAPRSGQVARGVGHAQHYPHAGADGAIRELHEPPEG